MALEKQMELFEDGGLKDEGGTTDPVSGNDVPPGSTQEEVRDDIPAQLSEGEFVFPADVVRYIGLEKLMQMRQEAKLGLKMMEDMGQMGNSDEAVMPDDIPFDLSDLDMEDEKEYNVGGFVPATPDQQQFGIAGYQQAAAPTTGFTQIAQPMQAASSQVQQAYTPVAQAPVPTMRQYEPAEIPTFSDFTLGEFGSYDELREYRNEAGNVIMIPFKDGQPISPIPEGYTYVDPEATKTEQVTTTPTTPQTTQVRETESDNDDKEEPRGAVFALGTFSEEGRMGGKRGEDYFDFNVSFDAPGGIGGYGSVISGLIGGSGIPENTIATLEYEGVELKLNAEEYNEAREDRTGEKAQEIIERFKEKRDQEKAAAKALAAEYGIKYTGQTLAEMAKATNAIDQKRKKEAAAKKAAQEKEQREAEERAAAAQQRFLASLYDDDDGDSDRGGNDYSLSESQLDDYAASYEGVTDFGFAEGGLAAKKKPKAKKMKRGGLASKK